jgi:hypothetical protein
VQCYARFFAARVLPLLAGHRQINIELCWAIPGSFTRIFPDCLLPGRTRAKRDVCTRNPSGLPGSIAAI